MKTIKFIFSFAAICFAANTYAQVDQGGTPLSASVNNIVSATTHYAVTPDFYGGLQSQDQSFSSSYKVGMMADVDVNFPESGTFTKIDDGHFIWQAAVQVNDVKGIGLKFDKFILPQGVKMFILNNNRKQAIGAYTIDNMNQYNTFVVKPVQGERAIIELNIAPGVSFDDIQLSTAHARAFFRGVEDLEYYSDDYVYGTLDAMDDAARGSASKCMLNAYCSQGDGYEVQRQATVKLIIPADGGYIGYCSGTMINNTKNSPTLCTRYLLTATHCEGTGTTTENYADWQLRFNFQYTDCAGTTPIDPVSKVSTGVEFISRDPLDPAAGPSDLDADFLLVKPTNLIPASWDVKLNGWDRDPAHKRAYLKPGKFIGFHHPNGDVKKVSTAQTIADAGTAWGLDFEEGYGAPGSSGSGIFDAEGELIGIASVAIYGAAPDSCYMSTRGILEAENTSTKVWYAKLAYCWENPSEPTGPNTTKLKPWLDPDNTGVLQLGPSEVDCKPLSISKVKIDNFGGDFNIYPNPSTDGRFQVNIRLDDNINTTVEVLDVTGKTILTQDLPASTNQIYNLDLSKVPNGIYLVKISNVNGFMTKRVAVRK